MVIILPLNFSHKGTQRGTKKKALETILIKSFCGGVQGGQFFQKAPPLAAGGKKLRAMDCQEVCEYRVAGFGSAGSGAYNRDVTQ